MRQADDTPFPQRQKRLSALERERLRELVSDALHRRFRGELQKRRGRHDARS